MTKSIKSMDLQTDGLICQNLREGIRCTSFTQELDFKSYKKKDQVCHVQSSYKKKMLKIIVRVIICTRNLKQELLASPPHRGKTSECVLAHN